MLVGIVRTFLLFSLVMLSLRLMGKRHIAELQPFELAITIMISALAAIPMEDTDIPLLNSIIPILVLLSIEVLLSIFTLKSEKGRSLVCGKPAILIENGKIVEHELQKNRMNINDLIEQLRIQGYGNLSDVEFAILESNGQLSVVPKSQKRPVTPEDLDLMTDYEGIPHPLIMDGRILTHNLEKLNLSPEWLRGELKKFEVRDPAEVFFAQIDPRGNLFFQVTQEGSGDRGGSI